MASCWKPSPHLLQLPGRGSVLVCRETSSLLALRLTPLSWMVSYSDKSLSQGWIILASVCLNLTPLVCSMTTGRSSYLQAGVQTRSLWFILILHRGKLCTCGKLAQLYAWAIQMRFLKKSNGNALVLFLFLLSKVSMHRWNVQKFFCVSSF